MKQQRKRCGKKKCFGVLVAALSLSFAMYSFAIASTTMNISDSSITHDNLQELRTEIAGLESSYYTMVNDLSLAQAQEEGFIKDQGIVFAHVDSTTLVAYNN